MFLAATRHLRNDESDILVFCNWDRFARSTIDNELIRKSLAKYGKRLISTQQQFLATGFDPEDDFELEAAIAHAAVDNEKERRRLLNRLHRGMAEKISQGGWGGHRPTYEYDVVQGELVLNRQRWQVVKKIIRLRKWAGWSFQRITDHLNENRIPAYSARKIINRRVLRARTQRTDGKWAMRSVATIVYHWEEGKRQAWKEHYEAKRVERGIK